MSFSDSNKIIFIWSSQIFLFLLWDQWPYISETKTKAYGKIAKIGTIP